MQIARLFETVYLLLNKRTITARNLAEHFEVSIRTIYRDVDVLSQAGIPIYTSKGKGGGISLMDHYVLNKSLLTAKEQEDILTSLSSMQMMQQHDGTALQKLGSIFQKEVIDWIDVDFHDWHLHEQEEKFNICKECILNLHVLTFQYSNQEGQVHKRTVEPLKLIFKGQAWYIFAYCLDRNAGRFFKLSRMKQVCKLDTSFVRREITMDTQQYQTNINFVQARFKIAKAMAFRVYDEFDTKNCVLKNDFLYLTCMIPDYEDTIYHLLSYGETLEIVEPQAMRDIVQEKIKQMKRNYNI